MQVANETDVVKVEKNNFEVVIVFHTRDVWYGVTMHSAFFMSEMVQELVGLRTQVKWMHDNYYNVDRPMITYHAGQMNKIRDRIRSMGWRVIRDDGRFFVFGLPEVVDKEKITEWLNSEKMRREKLKRYFLSDDFGLFKLCRELAMEVMTMKVKSVVSGQDVVGGVLLRYAMEIHEYATAWEAGAEKEKLVAGREIRRRMDRCCFVLAVLADRRAVDDGKLMRIGVCFMSIKNALDGKGGAK